MEQSLRNKSMFTLLLAVLFLGTKSFSQAAPELVFRNPVLVSGTALKEGAVYKFPAVTTGVDAHVKLKKFSRREIVMRTIDNTTTGWDKAFQPEFGLPGEVLPNQNWYIDFEMNFYEANTTSKYALGKISATTLDVDGDGNTVSEYYIVRGADSVKHAINTYLTSVRVPNRLCDECGKESDLKLCTNCNGTGNKNYSDPRKRWEADDNCKGTGKLHTECGHAFSNDWDNEMQSTTQGFNGIDTLATQVMANYVFMKEDKIEFRIGGTTGLKRSQRDMAIRQNSFWFKSFALAPPTTLPVKLERFTAAAGKQAVVLNWTTTDEEAFSHFAVERSLDGRTFTQIGVVFGRGGQNATSYSYKDAATTNDAVVSYRLHMVDVDGQAKYSHVVSVRLSEQSYTAATTITAYPNPVQNQVTISLPAVWQGQAVQVAVYARSGMRVHSMQYKKAGSTETLSLSHLPKGLYIVKASTKTGTAQQTIYKN